MYRFLYAVTHTRLGKFYFQDQEEALDNWKSAEIKAALSAKQIEKVVSVHPTLNEISMVDYTTEVHEDE